MFVFSCFAYIELATDLLVWTIGVLGSAFVYKKLVFRSINVIDTFDDDFIEQQEAEAASS